MAINWLTALKFLPWSDMIEYAPKLVSGAQKAWQRVKVGKEAVDANALVISDPQTELDNLQREVQVLQAQQVEMTALIKALADQNQRQVDAIAVLRTRTRLLCLLNVGVVIAFAIGYLAR